MQSRSRNYQEQQAWREHKQQQGLLGQVQAPGLHELAQDMQQAFAAAAAAPEPERPSKRRCRHSQRVQQQQQEHVRQQQQLLRQQHQAGTSGNDAALPPSMSRSAVSVDMFFIDWEKPRRVLAKGGGREEPGPISAWRGLLVVNEWNELQTARLTYPCFTLIFMVFILEGAHMKAAAYINPDNSDYHTYQNIQQSLLLRFAVAAVWFFIIGVAQVLWKVMFVHRFAGHPLHGFIDLLFLANTSAIILDDRHSGYYLHGRNQMHHSDTTLEDLNNSLLREEEGLVAGRGLISSYTGSVAGMTGNILASGPDAAALNDNQTFLMYVSPELRRKYENQLLSQVEQAVLEQRANKGVVTTAVRGPTRPRGSAMSASAVIAEAFKHAIDEVERNHMTQVIIPTYWQRLFRMPPESAAYHTVLQHDFHHSFAKTIFFGQEWRLYIFEALLFSSLYMALANAGQAGFITFIIWRVVVLIRRHWGENNLSRKTLVDRHFLI